MNTTLERLTQKKDKVDSYLPFPEVLIRNLDEWFQVELTYTSNAIEGNTLTRQETALVVEKGMTVEGKTITEHLEALSHARALELIKPWGQKTRKEITERMILDIHEILLQPIDLQNAGCYRNVAVRIAGSTVGLPNPAKVPDLMKEFVAWLHGENFEHTAKIAADAHLKLVTIHPFTDGNGRTARLLMNLLLRQTGYPPALIRKEDRKRYLTSLEQAQRHQRYDPYYQVIYEAVERSLDIYLEALELKEPSTHPQDKKLLKIGELAKISGESIPTLRYWTKQGLLKPAGHTAGGYQLYTPTMAERIAEIRQLQSEERLTIQEIKKKITTSGQ